MNNRRFLFGLLVFLAASLAVAFLPPLLVLAVAGAIALTVFLMYRLDIGLLILVFFFPYLGLVIDLSKFEALRDVPFLNQLNAPFVDIFGLILFIAWFLHVLLRIFETSRKRGKIVRPRAILRIFPFWKSFLPFLASAAVSLVNVPSQYFLGSVKYLARPVAFFYFAFFVPTISIIKKYCGETEEDKEGKDEERGAPRFLNRIFWAMYLTGLISAALGLISLFFTPPVGFPRAAPFAFGQIAPLGFNHNLLAETLIATAPFGFLLWWLGRRREGKEGKIWKWIFVGACLQIAIALLTFARTAWIVLAIQLVLFLFFGYRARLNAFLKRAAPVVALLIPLIGYMAWTLGTEVVRGSTLTRFDQIRIAWFYFLREPLIGNGIGTFLPSLWGIRAFLVEYGEPLEAHGIVWKLLFEQGLLGLATFAIFAGMILWAIFRKYSRSGNGYSRIRQAVLLCSLLVAIGSFSYQLFNTTYYTSKLWVPAAIAVAVAALYNQTAKSKREIMRTELEPDREK